MGPWLVLLGAAALIGCGAEGRITVNGEWSPWSTLQSWCVMPHNRQNLVTCGGGVETKYRSCTRPAPQGGGRACDAQYEGGLAITTRKDFPCNENPCPLPTQFMWSEWSDCSARCGRGLQKRYKMCGSVRRRLPGHSACHRLASASTTPQPMTIPPSTVPTPPAAPAAPAGPATAAPATNTSANATSGNSTTTVNGTTTTTLPQNTTTTVVNITTTTTVVNVTTTTTVVSANTTTPAPTPAPAPGAPAPAAAPAGGCSDPCTCFQPEAKYLDAKTAGGPCPRGGAACDCPGAPQESWIKFFELSESSICGDQPDPVMAEYTDVGCLKNYDEATIRPCNTWRYYGEFGMPDLWNHSNCPDPCLTHSCPKFAKCTTELSTTEDKVLDCQCQMGTVMKADNSSCIVPPPTTPTPRPIPTMETKMEQGVTAVSKTASSLIIIFLTITIILFLVFGIFDPMRVIHMCEEVSLLAAHLCMMPTMYTKCTEEDEQLCVAEPGCRVISIAIHYFFTVCFMFMFLEAIHMYGLVASVVKRKGMLATKQNIVVGWGMPAFIVLFNMCFEYDNYGGVYHCWLQMDSGLMYGQYMPIIVLVVTSFTIIEAAGAADEYPALAETDEVDKVTAQISQRTLLLILPLVFASFVCGTVAVFEQNPAMYGIFTILNGVLGGAIFFFHVTSNKKTRALWGKICGKKEKE